ncbi:MAG: sugar ABC transporter substrate-binding protein [Bifidobacteriaceae bacterium]|jgi:multiple sugar transport system substrate-binding protein|nr:sugar ABC transporter substrate-binding protein [Bifidobacteriaceae bacterium]
MKIHRSKKSQTNRPARTLAAGIAALAIAALGAGCTGTTDDPDPTEPAATSPNTTETVELEFWGWVPGMQGAVDLWNDQNPDLQVNFHSMTGDDVQKIDALLDAGTGPDIVMVSTHNLPDYVITGRVQDITAHVSAAQSQFTPSGWAGVTFDGKVYATPEDTGPGAVMYRLDLFTEAGLEFPQTWDAYLAAARTLKERGIAIANIDPLEISQWILEITQAGGTWFDTEADQWVVSVNDQASKIVADRWQTLLDEELVTTEVTWTPEYWSAFADGRVASILHAAWFPVLLAENAADTAGNWRVAPMPLNGTAEVYGNSGGSVVAVSNTAKDVPGAAAFAVWLNSDPAAQDILVEQGGVFPDSINGLASAKMLAPQEFFGGQVVNEVYLAAADKRATNWVDGPNYAFASSAISEEVAKAVAGEGTVAQALDRAQQRTVEDLVARGFDVAGQ